VFAGDFDLAAAAAVSGLDEFEALDLVEQLTDKSMLEADPARDRYRLLETLRQYGWDRLAAAGRLEQARGAHAVWYSTLSGEQAALMGSSGRQVGALDRLEADYDNLRAALAFLIEEREAEAAIRMVRRLVGLFNIRHPREGFAWFQQVLAIADDVPPKTRARLLGDTAHAAQNAGDGRAQAHFAQAAVEVGGAEAPAIAHWLLATWSLACQDYVAASEQARQAFDAALASNDRTTRVIAAGSLVQALAGVGDEPGARRLIPELIDLAEDLGNPTITAASYMSAAEALVQLDSRPDAIAALEKAVAQADAGGPILMCDSRSFYALVVDDPDDAARILLPTIPIAKNQLSGFHQLQTLMAAAKILADTAREPLAARLLGTYRHHATQSQGAIYAARGYEPLINRLADTLGATVFDTEIGRGAQLTPAQALQLADDAINQTT